MNKIRTREDLLFDQLGIAKTDLYARTFAKRLLQKGQYREFILLVIDSLEAKKKLEEDDDIVSQETFMNIIDDPDER